MSDGVRPKKRMGKRDRCCACLDGKDVEHPPFAPPLPQPAEACPASADRQPILLYLRAATTNPRPRPAEAGDRPVGPHHCQLTIRRSRRRGARYHHPTRHSLLYEDPRPEARAAAPRKLSLIAGRPGNISAIFREVLIPQQSRPSEYLPRKQTSTYPDLRCFPRWWRALRYKMPFPAPPIGKALNEKYPGAPPPCNDRVAARPRSPPISSSNPAESRSTAQASPALPRARYRPLIQGCGRRAGSVLHFGDFVPPARQGSWKRFVGGRRRR